MYKRKRALYNAVSALILLIASVILTLIVIGFAFGLMSAFSSIPQIEQIGTGTITANGQATFMLRTNGNIQIVSAQLAGTNNYAVSITPETLSAGINTITVSFNNVNIMPGTTYVIIVILSDGEEVLVSAIGE